MTAILSSPYLYLFAGMFCYLLIDFGTFKRSVSFNYSDAFEQYFDLNWYWFVTGFFVDVIILSLNNLGELPFLNDIGFNINKTPGTAFLLGLLNQWVVIKLRKFITPIRSEEKYNSVVKVEKGL